MLNKRRLGQLFTKKYSTITIGIIMYYKKFDSRYKGYGFNYSKHNNENLRDDVFITILSLLNEMTDRHSKVFFMMFTLNLPSTYSEDNPGNYAVLSRFIVSLTDHCRNEGYDPMHFWARESQTIGHEQYNFMLLLDGDFVKNTHVIIEIATELWARTLNIEHGQGLVHQYNIKHNAKHYCNVIQHGGVLLKKKDKFFTEAYIHCFSLADDMATRSGNDGARTYVNEYGYSRHK
ncbi:MAG: inovirus-type Gp2 protein [Chlorobium sp.]|nr:inovirus-type Gp2 protein [Chlorobium sp.]